jgi:hypothetical protein
MIWSDALKYASPQFCRVVLSCKEQRFNFVVPAQAGV